MHLPRDFSLIIDLHYSIPLFVSHSNFSLKINLASLLESYLKWHALVEHFRYYAVLICIKSCSFHSEIHFFNAMTQTKLL